MITTNGKKNRSMNTSYCSIILSSVSSSPPDNKRHPISVCNMINSQSTIQAKNRKAKRTKVLRCIFLGLTCFLVCYPFLFLWLASRNDNSSDKSSESNRRHEFGASGTSKKYAEVSCPKIISLSKREDFYDPNKALPESPKRLTITEPPFWISLFIEWFDKMRWAAIYVRGNYYELGLTNIFKEILTEENKSPGRVLDVGMNIGWYSLWSRSFGHTVVSFEPNPAMHVRVCESLILNGWDKDNSVQLFPFGVGNEEAEMTLTTGNNPGGSSFVSERLAPKYRKTMPVKVVRLDDIAEQEGWLSENALPIHLMKIDVEGFEYFSLLGAKNILASGKVTNIMMENSSTDSKLVLSLFHLLYESGYKVHALLSVDGDPYHNDKNTLTAANEAISKITTSMNPNDFSQNWLIKVTNNIWWKKRNGKR